MMGISKKSPSGLPAISPTRGEKTRCTTFLQKLRVGMAVKPLPLVGRGWGGVLTRNVGDSL
ncbi:hypothetical protein YH62_11725 [Rhizobium sp. LC145]|nr:hypothetical protein YH62_11725 [Rhizobium sp. LC145]